MNSCSIIPQVKNYEGDLVDSILFKDLLDKTKNNRDLAKKVYKASQNINKTFEELDVNGEPTLRSALIHWNTLVNEYSTRSNRLAENRSESMSNVPFTKMFDITSSEAVLNNILNNSSDELHKDIASFLLTNVDKIESILFYVNRDSASNNLGAYFPESRRITMSTNLIGKYKADYIYETALHELVHAYTIKSLAEPETDADKAFVADLDKVYKALKQNRSFNSYGFTNQYEFISEFMSNQAFRDSLNFKTPTILQKIINAIKKLLGLSTEISSVQELDTRVKEFIMQTTPGAITMEMKELNRNTEGVTGQINKYLRQSKKDNKYVKELEKAILTIHKRVKYRIGETNLKIKTQEGLIRSLTYKHKGEIKQIVDDYVQYNSGVYDTGYQNSPVYKKAVNDYETQVKLLEDDIRKLEAYKVNLNKDLVDLSKTTDLTLVEAQYADLAVTQMEEIDQKTYDINNPEDITELSNDYNFLQLFSKFTGMHSIKGQADILANKLMTVYISPYVGELSTNNLNLAGLDNKNLDVSDLLANNPDVQWLEKYFRGMGDYPRLEAQLVQSITIEAVKRARADTEVVGKEILEHKHKLAKWATKNGYKNLFGQAALSKVYDLLQEVNHLGRLDLVKPFNKQYYIDVNANFKAMVSKDAAEATRAKLWLKNNYYTPSTNVKYINPKYTYLRSHPELSDFYDYFQAKVAETYEKLPEHVTLRNKEKIPSLVKDTIFEAFSLHPKHILKSIKLIAKTMLFGTGTPVFYDENGNLPDDFTITELTNDQIRLKMIGEVDPKQKSNDLGHVLHSFYSFGNEYQQMNKVLPIARLIQNIVAKKTYGDKGITGSQSRVNAAMDLYISKTITKTNTGDKVPIKLLGTQIYDNNGNVIGEQQFYWSTFINHILIWTRLVQLGLNVASGITNLLAGISANITEASGKQYYDLPTYFKAVGIYLGDAFNQRTMFLKPDKNMTKVELLSEFIQPLDEVAEYDTRREIEVKNQNVLVRSVAYTFDKAYILQQLGEDVIHKSSMVAYLLSKKIQGTDGKMHTLWSLFDVKNDELVFNDKIAGTKDYASLLKHDKETIIAINAKNQGDYSKGNASVHSNETLYKVATLFRKWLPAMIADRYQSRRYNFKTGNYDEGFFRSGSRAISKAFTNQYLGIMSIITQNQDMLLNKKEITKEEMIASRKMLSDMIQIAVLTLLPKLLIPPPEDEKDFSIFLPDWYEKWNPGFYKNRREFNTSKDPMTYMVKYLMDFTNRVASDRLQFYNIAAYPETLQRMAIIQQFKEIGQVFDAIGNQAFGEEKNKKILKGLHKGENRLLKETRDLVPYWKQVDKLQKQGEKKLADLQK